MSDDEPDLELLQLLRQSLGISSPPKDEVSADTGVLRDAEFIYNNAIDVAIDMYGTRDAAANVYAAMHKRGYSTQAWSEHALHPKRSESFSDVDLVNFVFTMDLLNFSFWSEKSPSERFQVEYSGRLWTGYNSLVASLRRALEDGTPITTPRFWNDPRCSDELLRNIFRSATDEVMPLLEERIAILREAGRVLHEAFGGLTPEAEPVGTMRDVAGAPALDTKDGTVIDELTTSPFTAEEASPAHQLQTSEVPIDDSASGATEDPMLKSDIAKDVVVQSSPVQGSSETTNIQERVELETTAVDLTVVRLIEKADHSAGKLVNLLVKHLPSFRDEARFEGRRVSILKRAQILVADLWAAFQGSSYGAFDDIDCLTMFADYRVPQMLHALGVLTYSPVLLNRIRSSQLIEPGHSWEVQLRGCSIWAVELIRREIERAHPEASADINAVLIDFFLYDLAKEREAADAQPMLPHHRTRSVWY